ncbi:MAG: hypothetical protein JSW41_01355 [Candidatus Aenigmatarchaeota archaeon]|nr:MAG: hypothetical protein JSW41_01355 [Candidatus Aenigmarchaeota archaeon]
MTKIKELHDFRRVGDVYSWLRKHDIEPSLLTGKKALSMFRQKYQAWAEGLDWTSHDFDLILTPIGFPYQDRSEMVSEYELLSWLKGKPPGSIKSIKSYLDRVNVGFRALKPWLEELRINPEEKRDVEMRALVTELKRGNIPKSVLKAIDLGIDVRKYEKFEPGTHEDQARGGIIRLDKERKIAYNVFRWLDVDKIIPGVPQNAEDGEWLALAYSGNPAEELSEIWKDEYKKSKTKEQVEMEEPETGFKELQDKKKATDFVRGIRIL